MTDGFCSASSPYVTTVGGFVYAKGQAPTGDTISSGGFSNFYSRPSYQDAAVQAYLSKYPFAPYSTLSDC